LASVHGDKTPTLLSNLIIQWTEVSWIGATYHWRWSQGRPNRSCWNSKHKTV